MGGKPSRGTQRDRRLKGNKVAKTRAITGKKVK